MCTGSEGVLTGEMGSFSGVTTSKNEISLPKEFSKSKPRPLVGMPLGRDFNECVSMDLKIHNEGYIFYMIDVFTRFCVAAFISKTYSRPKTRTMRRPLKLEVHFKKMGAHKNERTMDHLRDIKNVAKKRLTVSSFI